MVLVLLDVVSDPDARLGLPRGGETVVEITAQAKVKRPVSFGDRVLNVKSEFLDVGVADEVEQASTAGQVVGEQGGIEIRVRAEPGASVFAEVLGS